VVQNKGFICRVVFLFFRSFIPFLYKIAICFRSIPVDFSSSVNACKVVSHRILDIKKKGYIKRRKENVSMKASCVLSINNICWSYVISRARSLRRIELMRVGSLLVFSPSSSSSILQGNSLPKVQMSIPSLKYSCRALLVNRSPIQRLVTVHCCKSPSNWLIARSEKTRMS